MNSITLIIIIYRSIENKDEKLEGTVEFFSKLYEKIRDATFIMRFLLGFLGFYCII